jgi:hypothetical protein
VVDDVRLAPARAARAGGRGRVLGHPRVQEQEVDRSGGHGVRERTHALQVREVEREELHGVLRAVVRHGLERGAEGGDVACAEDEAVAVRALGEQLLERLEALGEIVSGEDRGGMGGLARPEVRPTRETRQLEIAACRQSYAPVATIVLAGDAMCSWCDTSTAPCRGCPAQSKAAVGDGLRDRHGCTSLYRQTSGLGRLTSSSIISQSCSRDKYK